jgi:hypothetical protein
VHLEGHVTQEKVKEGKVAPLEHVVHPEGHVKSDSRSSFRWAREIGVIS